jgi:hypothetical protein
VPYLGYRSSANVSRLYLRQFRGNTAASPDDITVQVLLLGLRATDVTTLRKLGFCYWRVMRPK